MNPPSALPNLFINNIEPSNKKNPKYNNIKIKKVLKHQIFFRLKTNLFVSTTISS